MNKEAVYYRKTDIKKFEDFKDGDCVCEVCNGWGYFYDCEDNKVSQCYHCKGIGKLDWVSNVTGAMKMSDNSTSAAYSANGHNETSGIARPTTIPPPPTSRRNLGLPPFPPSKRQIPSTKNNSIPHKKISWKERIMNMVADKC